MSDLLSRDRWARLTALFDELAECAPADRERRLEALRGSDTGIARELERLLAADAAEIDLLDRPVHETAASEEAMPERAGAYRIVGRLGRGGMAEVFAGERDDGVFEQRVAVKVLRRGLDTEDLLARFGRERRILARLDHPAIARLLDAGRLADGRPFLVMERVDGLPIHRFARDRGLSIEERLGLICAISDAVAYAHRNLVVHRDLKPSNVLVSTEGSLKLLDFGIAKILDPDGTGSPKGTVRETRMLTPAYAAPEQIGGEPTTTATDVWGLGALAFELLVGEPPYPLVSAGRSLARPQQAPPRASARRLELGGGADVARREASRIAGDIDLIVQKALSLDPERRYSSAEALAGDLRRHLAGRPVNARPASLGYRVRMFARRHRAGVAAATLTLFSLSIGGGVAAWQARIAARERARPLPTIRHLTYSSHDSAPAVSPDGRSVAFHSRRDGRSRIWLADLVTGDEFPLTEGPDDLPGFSPDGREILFVRSENGNNAVHVAPVAGGPSRLRIDHAISGDFGPDGRIAVLRLALGAGSPQPVLSIAAHDGALEELARLPGRTPLPPRWSPDGTTIAVATSSPDVGRGGLIVLVDAKSGAVRQLSLEGSAARGLAWAGSSRLLTAQPDNVTGWITGSASRIVARDLDGGNVREVLTSPTSVGTIDVAPGGRLILTSGTFRVHLKEVDLGSGEGSSRSRWLTRADSSDRQPAYAPDGERVVFSSNRGGNLDLWTLELATGAVRRVTHDPALDWDPVFTRDGKLLWSTNRSGSFEIWQAEADGSGARQISRNGVDAENPAATPDGAHILYMSGNAASRGIMRMRSDGSAPELIVPGNVFLPELSPDGRLVAFLDLSGEEPQLRVAEVASGRTLPFALRLPSSDAAIVPDLGRSRWFPDSRALASIDREPGGAFVVTRHVVVPRSGAPEPSTRLADEPGFAAESLGLSPDGQRLVVAYWDGTSNLMLAESVPGLDR